MIINLVTNGSYFDSMNQIHGFGIHFESNNYLYLFFILYILYLLMAFLFWLIFLKLFSYFILFLFHNL